MAIETGATLRYVVYDILRDLKQGYPDAAITPFQMTYWVLVHADRLKKLHIEKRDSGAYVVPFTVDVEVDPYNGSNYFELPTNIYDMHKDRGVEFIAYPATFDSDFSNLAGTLFTMVNRGEIRRLYFREDEKPSPSNPYAYRLQDRIYLIGVEQINLTSVDVGLYTTFDPANLNMDIDQPFDFPQDLLSILKRQILDMGRFTMRLPKDLMNDGATGDNAAVPADKIISVNDVLDQSKLDL